MYIAMVVMEINIITVVIVITIVSVGTVVKVVTYLTVKTLMPPPQLPQSGQRLSHLGLDEKP